MHPTASKLYIAQTQKLFYCHCKIKIPMAFGENLLSKCFELMRDIDLKYNSYQPTSYFSQINDNAGEWVTVDNVTLQIIEMLQLVADCTSGVYDISVTPLLHLWGFYKNDNYSVPSQSSIEKAKEKVDFRKIEVKGTRVRIGKGQMLITGSFIKAWAVDAVVAFLQQHGVTDGIVNAGGSTIFALNDEEHPFWTVNVPLTSVPQIQQIAISNQAFSLSASLHNSVEIDGKRYGHIINAVTGWPSQTSQVGILTSNAFVGDILSTAIFSLEENQFSSVFQKLQALFEFQLIVKN